MSFTIAFFLTFELSEKYNKKRAPLHQEEMEKFRLDAADDLSPETVKIRPGNVLVAVRNPNSLGHLKKTLEKTDTRKVDIAVLAVRNVSQAGSGEHSLEADQLFTSSETELFSKVVYMAEKAGKHVELIVVPGIDPNLAGVQAAQRLQSSRIVAGVPCTSSDASASARRVLGPTPSMPSSVSKSCGARSYVFSRIFSR